MCSRATRMRFRKGSKVEVFGTKDVSSGSWFSAEIVHGNGHYYTVMYDMGPGGKGAGLFDRVPRRAIRPCPPVMQVVQDWAYGDVVEVFHGFSWKMATVVSVFSMDRLLVKFVGLAQELEVTKGNVRPRLCWQDDEWKLIGKGSNTEEMQNVTLKLRCKYNAQQMETTASNCYKNSNFRFSNINSTQEVCTIASQTLKRKRTNCHSQNMASQKIRATEKFSKRLNQFIYTNNRLTGADSIASSVASCSISGKNMCKFPGTGSFVDNNDDYSSDAESCCRVGSEKGNSLLLKDEKLTDEVHRIELHAYRSTIEALHASGPLSWEQETLLTNLRDSLHITNDEHLMELRNLVSPTCIPNS